MRMQCSEGHWFQHPGPCPYGPPGDPCGYVPPDPEPLPPARREVEEQVTKVDRDALRVMPDARVAEVHADGFAAARRALAEAEWRKAHKQEAAK